MGRLLQGTWNTRSASWSKARRKKSYAPKGAANTRERLLRGRADYMKQQPTEAEERIFHALKYLRIPFMPQVVIGRYIVDFLLTNRNIVLEIDGSSHKQKRAYDQSRDDFLTRLGWQVIRVSNEHATIEWVTAHVVSLPVTDQCVIIQRLSDARAIERDRIRRRNHSQTLPDTRHLRSA